MGAEGATRPETLRQQDRKRQSTLESDYHNDPPKGQGYGVHTSNSQVYGQRGGDGFVIPSPPFFLPLKRRCIRENRDHEQTHSTL
jgi:hypothetical protein